LPDVAPAQRERFAGAESRVGEHGHQCCVAGAAIAAQVRSYRLDGGWRQRPHDTGSPLGWLAHRRGRVDGDPLPEYCPAEHALQDHERLSHGRGAYTRRFEVGAEQLDPLRREATKLAVAQSWEDMVVPQAGVALQRVAGKVRAGVEPKPLLGEGGYLREPKLGDAGWRLARPELPALLDDGDVVRMDPFRVGGVDGLGELDHRRRLRATRDLEDDHRVVVTRRVAVAVPEGEEHLDVWLRERGGWADEWHHAAPG
jgi:hypothetical protein